jgi:two-component system sensor histidine kinase/response regulator
MSSGSQHAALAASEAKLDAVAAQSEARFSDLLDATPDAILGIGTDGSIELANAQVERIFGYSREQLLGRSVDALVPALLPAPHAEHRSEYLADLCAGPKSARGDLLARRRDGSEFPVEISLTPLETADGPLVIAAIRDITERAREQAELARLAAAVDSSYDAIISLSSGGVIETWNESAEELYGYRAEEVIGRHVAMLARHPAERATMLSNLGGEARSQIESQDTRKDGSVLDVAVTDSPIRDLEGRVTGIVRIVRDITDRVQIQQALSASEERLALAQQAGRIGSFDRIMPSGQTLWSPEMEAIYGLEPGESGHGFENRTRMVHPHDRYDVEQSIQQAIDDRADWRAEFRIERADGEERWVSGVGRPYFDDAGQCVRFVGVNMDVTERKLAERKVNEAARFFELSSDMVCTAGFDGVFVELNDRWEQTLGWSKDEVHSRPFIEFVHSSDTHRWAAAAGRLSAGETITQFLIRVATKDGGWRWLEWNAIGVPEEELMYASARDVTIRIDAETVIRKAEAEVAAARDAALEASRMKSAFLANMSHEIRTPLNGVIGMSDLLLDSPLDVEQQENARLLKGAGETLVAVVDDILDFSKIEAGALRLEYVDFDLVEAVEDACDLIAESAHEKGLELTMDLGPELPELVRGDSVRVRQVISNLLSNALKFTSEGEISLALRSSLRSDGLTDVEVEVRDTGIGVDETRLAQIFEPFVQADDSTTRRFGGTGLGLAIVRQLVEMMDGELGAESVAGEGSRFWFRLPLEARETPEAAQQQPSLGLARLLVVDDNETNRRLMVQLTRRWEMEVTAVNGADEALACLRDAAAREEPFQCAALDMHMPGTDGIELAQAIYRDQTFPTPALLMLTSTYDDRRDAREAGIDVYMTKPVRRSRLRNALAEALGIQTRREQAPAGYEGAAAGSSPLILIVEDNDVNQILAVRMLDRRGYETEVVGDGRQALEALERRPYAAVLMDCQMPELNGYDATSELRRREPAGNHTPVIAMTAHALRGDREKCLASGMDDYLAKPLRPEELDRILRSWAPRTTDGSGARDARIEPTQDQPPADESPLDPGGIELLRSEFGSSGTLATLVELFGRQTPELLARMRTATEADDAASVKASAHKLKGGCLTLAAKRMAELCRGLEIIAERGTLEAEANDAIDLLEAAFHETYAALQAVAG